MALPTTEQAAKRRAKGYLNDNAFVPIIYFLTAPVQNISQSARKGVEA